MARDIGLYLHALGVVDQVDRILPQKEVGGGGAEDGEDEAQHVRTDGYGSDRKSYQLP
jgi:hypothetical protein